jgi:hypothetical protein
MTCSRRAASQRHHWRGRFHLQPWCGRRSEAISHLPRQGAEIDGLPVQLDASLLQADRVEELVDQTIHTQDLTQGSAQVVLRPPRPRSQPLQTQSERGERSAELVGCDGEEVLAHDARFVGCANGAQARVAKNAEARAYGHEDRRGDDRGQRQ